jgi:hypothetical protein
MNDLFARRVHAAAVAGWWSLLSGAIFLTVVWFVLLRLMQSRQQIFPIALWMIAVFKLCLWLWALICLFLTLWSRQLRKQAAG